MNGILVIDKPSGVTSHDVVQRVRRMLRLRRVGHAGTLDPMATGILLVAVGEGTRLVEFLMEGTKCYRAELKLGETTDTQDSEGEIVSQRPVGPLEEEAIRRVAAGLTGTLFQVPPMYSALKRQGVPLYRLARQGIDVDRPAREITVHRLSVSDVRLPFVTLEVECSKGTYVRTLCHDLGEALGSGAHMTALRRTRCGAFDVAQSIPLDSLTADEAPRRLLSLRAALRGLPALQLDTEGLGRLRNGIPPEEGSVEGELPSAGSLAALVDGEELRAVVRYEPSRTRERRGDFELLRVFHPR